MRVVESSGDVDAVCEPPRATLPRGLSFPPAARRQFAAAPAAAAVAEPAAAAAEEGPERDAERMMAAMSEADIAEAQAEIRRMAGARTIAILERRAAKKAAETKGASGVQAEEQLQEAPPAPAVPPPAAMERELLLPPIEHDKLAWTDPETRPRPRERERDVAQSLRARALRFGLQGEVLEEAAAGPETYGAGLHHHGEEPERAGYTLEELATLMRSQNEPQNVFAVQLVGRLAQRVAAGGLARERLYPEAGARSMSVGEGVLWELLGLQLPVALRLCFLKRSPALREASRVALVALCAAFADDAELGRHSAEPHWGALVFPSAPLFEDDGSEEMEMRDGLRALVRQLDVLPLLDPTAAWGLECLAHIAGHSRQLALLVAAQPAIVGAAAAAAAAATAVPHADRALRLLRLLLAASSDHVRLLEHHSVPATCWRHLLVPSSVAAQREAALLLRLLLLWNEQVAPLLDCLPELLRRAAGGQLPVSLACLLCEAAVAPAKAARGASEALGLLGGALGSLAQLARPEDAASVLHMAASVARCFPAAEGLRGRVLHLFSAAQQSPAGQLAFARLVNASEETRRVAPAWLWSEERLGAVLVSPPQVRQDASNRYQTQRRTRLLVAEREGILLQRELLIAGGLLAEAPLVAFGRAVDLAGRLALAGADEWLLLDFAERVLLHPALAERAAQTLHGGGPYDAEDARAQSERMCAALRRGMARLCGPAAWVERCRAVAGAAVTQQLPRPGVRESFFAEAGDGLGMGTLLGAEWLFELCRSGDAAEARAAAQFLTLAEASGACVSLALLPPVSKLVRLCGLFAARQEAEAAAAAAAPFEDPAVGAALRALLERYAGQVDCAALEQADDCNPMQAATDLVGNFLSHGNNSPVFGAFVFFFMRADLPHDFRQLVWTSLAPAWRLLRLAGVDARPHHLSPPESSRPVLAAMEEALRSGQLTERSNSLVFWLAVHHLAAWAFGGGPGDEWTRLQLLRRLRDDARSPRPFQAVCAYTLGDSFPPAADAAPTALPPERAALLAKVK